MSIPTASGLQHRLELAAPPGRHHPVPDDHEPHHRHPDLADEDDDGHPPGHDPDDRQAHEGHPGQRLVGDRVGHLAEVGDLLAAPREVAVDAVGDHRHAEDDQRGHPVAPHVPALEQQQPPEDRDEEMRNTVRELARFQALGAARSDGPAGPAASRRRAVIGHGAASRSTPIVATTVRPRDRRPRARARRSATHERRRAVDVGSLERGAALPPRRRSRQRPRLSTSTSSTRPRRPR